MKLPKINAVSCTQDVKILCSLATGTLTGWKIGLQKADLTDKSQKLTHGVKMCCVALARAWRASFHSL